jgi:cell division transport system permease protein
MMGLYMKFLKNLISFFVPLFIVLITFTLYSIITDVVSEYRKNIINDYAIMIVAHTPFAKNELTQIGSIDIKQIQKLSREDVIDNMKEQLSKDSLKLLEQKLPFFYKIYLVDYPTTTQLKQIRDELGKISNIKRVETFSSDHSKIYSLLVLCESIIAIVFVIIVIFAILILSKQISIWFFEHNKRISIIKYHGGSTIYSATPIIKLSLLSSILATAVTIFLTLAIKKNLSMIVSPEIFAIIPNINNLNVDFVQIAFISFGISIVSIVGVLVKHKIK